MAKEDGKLDRGMPIWITGIGRAVYLSEEKFRDNIPIMIVIMQEPLGKYATCRQAYRLEKDKVQHEARFISEQGDEVIYHNAIGSLLK